MNLILLASRYTNLSNMFFNLFDRDVPPDVMSFSLTLYNKGKRSKDTEVADLTVELASLTNGEEMDEWYPLSGVTPIGEWGALRLRIRYRLFANVQDNTIYGIY